MGKGNNQLQSILVILSHLKGVKKKKHKKNLTATSEVHSPEEYILRPIIRVQNRHFSPAPHHHATKSLCATAALTQYMLACWQ